MYGDLIFLSMQGHAHKAFVGNAGAHAGPKVVLDSMEIFVYTLSQSQKWLQPWGQRLWTGQKSIFTPGGNSIDSQMLA